MRTTLSGAAPTTAVARLLLVLPLLLLALAAPGLPTSSYAAPVAAEGTVSLDIEEFDISSGPAIVDVDVTLTNDSTTRLSNAQVTFTGPVGWQVAPGSQEVRALKPGQSVLLTYQLRLPEIGAGFKLRTFTATASYRGGDGAGTATTSRVIRSGEPLADLAAGYNNVGITSEANPTPGNFDGSGNSFSAEKLAAAGAGRGATVQALGATLQLPDVAPGTPDNVTGAGQAVELSGQGQRLVFLGSGAGTNAVGPATVYYTDGTSSSGSLGFPNWSFQEPTAHGATLVVSSTGRNRPNGYGDSAYQYRLFANSIPLTAGKTVDFVVLPGNPSLHVFDLAISP